MPSVSLSVAYRTLFCILHMDRRSGYLLLRPCASSAYPVSGSNPRLACVGWEIALRVDIQAKGQPS